MTPEQQRIKIAQLQGWKMHNHPDCLAKKEGWVSRDWETWVMKPDGDLVFNSDIPDYLNSRGALAPVLAGLTEDESYLFGEYLYVDVLKLEEPGNMRPVTYRDLFLVNIATPAQLCEAYLRTKGEWEDEK